MKSANLICLRSRRKITMESEPPVTFLSALEGINTLRKYTMAGLSSTVNKVYMGQQKVKQQQRTLMDI
jgi:hypothetical protein